MPLLMSFKTGFQAAHFSFIDRVMCGAAGKANSFGFSQKSNKRFADRERLAGKRGNYRGWDRAFRKRGESLQGECSHQESGVETHPVEKLIACCIDLATPLSDTKLRDCFIGLP